MGLVIRVCRGKPFTEGWEILYDDESDSLGGPEASRQRLWGSSIVESLGLKLMPVLSTGFMMYACGEQLDELEAEMRIIRENAAEISPLVHYNEYSIFAITNNILKAIARAREIDGCVLIW